MELLPAQHLTAWSRLAMAVALAMSVVVGGRGMVDGARILGIAPTPSISHQMPFQALMKALAARGHHITVISPNPLKEPVPNYTDIDLSFIYPRYRQKFTFANLADVTGMELTHIMTVGMPEILDMQISSPQIQNFLSTNPKFDMVFLEWFWFQAYFGIVHHVGSPPIVGFLSLGGKTNSYNAIGNPGNPAFNPETLLGYSDRMTFFQRVYNTYVNLWMSYHWNWVVFPTQEALMRKHFGDAPPPVAETERNMSLLVLNNHWSTDYPRAQLPNVVMITGTHIKDTPDPLPKDLQEWMDSAGTDGGVVYFSLGSNVLSKDLPQPKRAAILRAFSRLPLRVLWKWEEDDLPGRPDNVRVAKWLPQQAVLAHPSTRLFITQGGLQSFQEAVYHAVPLIGIPFFADQPYNSERMVAAGVGKRLELKDLDEESLYSAITSIIQDKRYKDNMRKMSEVFREHKGKSMDSALWWIEYVLRHNGAPHLRSAALRLSWYQYLLLDVIAAAVAFLAIFVGITWIFIRTTFRIFCGKRGKLSNKETKLKSH